MAAALTPVGTPHLAMENIENKLARPWFHFVLAKCVLMQWKGTRKLPVWLLLLNIALHSRILLVKENFSVMLSPRQRDKKACSRMRCTCKHHTER